MDYQIRICPQLVSAEFTKSESLFIVQHIGIVVETEGWFIPISCDTFFISIHIFFYSTEAILLIHEATEIHMNNLLRNREENSKENEKSNKCPYCEEDFSKYWTPQWRLKIHIRQKHSDITPKKEEPKLETQEITKFSCNYCHGPTQQLLWD